ncbi:hypothetical protein [Niveispirillum cyanobacteriorum]|uniref:hypothetical protein n=1 Tax=Niveispirillum cyanobacteriorum TaxID=1612173 RepID=UPI001319C974|nr:hypothetical protein [Niveispirillum cyanobacteriorum]
MQKGTYSDRVTVNVYQLIDGTPYGPIASRTAQVRTKVRSVVSASVIVDGVTRPLNGSVGTLDLGDLTRGGGGRFDLDISGNGDYSLSLSSSNGGRLVGAAGSASAISFMSRAVPCPWPAVRPSIWADLAAMGCRYRRWRRTSPGRYLFGQLASDHHRQLRSGHD